MVDCKTASELIMKYLDKDITKQQEALLDVHISSCESCRIEFETLKDACIMLEDIEFEEPPADIEKNILMRIKSEDGLKAWKMGVAVFIIIIAGWIGITNLFIYAPVIDVLKDSFNIFSFLVNSLIDIVSTVWSVIFSGAVRLFALGRALKTAEMAILDMYNALIISMILSGAIILKLYSYVLKTFRR